MDKSYGNIENRSEEEEYVQVPIKNNSESEKVNLKSVEIQMLANSENTNHVTPVSNSPIELEIKMDTTSKKDHLERLHLNDKVLFVFVNPRSGSEEGKLFFNIVNNNNSSTKGYKLLDLEHNEKFAVYFFSIVDRKDYESGCALLDEYLMSIDSTYKLRVLVAGGDGTVLSIIEDLNFRGVDINRCVFGHIPLGTGNDLSNALGFGCVTQIDSQLSSLQKILIKYFTANFGRVDIWEMRLTVDKEKGEIIEVKQEDKKPKADINGVPISTYRRSFINYFSLGYDARVGFGFEKKRSGNRCWNKCIYFWEGCKKNCCRKTLPLNSFLHSFQVFDNENVDAPEEIEKIDNKPNMQDKPFEDDNINLQIPIGENNLQPLNMDECFENSELFEKYARRKTKVYFRSRTSLMGVKEEDKKNYKEIVLKGEPVSLVAQNINFYMGGVKDIWKKSKGSLGLEVMQDNKPVQQETKTLSLLLESCQQSYNDQKLEFFSYSSALKVGFEKISTGQADKIYHGKGPILIQFNETPERSKLDKFNRVYMNIDGEFYHIVKPVELRVRLNKKICGGSAYFLIGQ